MMAKTIEIPEREYLAIIDARDRFAAEVVDLRRQMEAERTNAWVKANLYLDANADLRRQLAHMTQWRDSAIVDGNAARDEAGELRRQLDTVGRERDAALRETDQAIVQLRRELMEQAARHDMAMRFADRDIADLRRQLAECQAGRLAEVERAVHASMALARAESERNDLRRQLEATQVELNRARRALHLRNLEDTGLYDAYGQPLK